MVVSQKILPYSSLNKLKSSFLSLNSSAQLGRLPANPEFSQITVATAQVAQDDHICHCLEAAGEVELYSCLALNLSGELFQVEMEKSQASTARKCMSSFCSCIASFVPSFLSSWGLGSCLCRILQRFFQPVCIPEMVGTCSPHEAVSPGATGSI